MQYYDEKVYKDEINLLVNHVIVCVWKHFNGYMSTFLSSYYYMKETNIVSQHDGVGHFVEIGNGNRRRRIYSLTLTFFFTIAKTHFLKPCTIFSKL